MQFITTIQRCKSKHAQDQGMKLTLDVNPSAKETSSNHLTAAQIKPHCLLRLL